MIKAMRTAASGMEAQQMNVDNIANNLANVNTTGFKKSRIEFQDILYNKIRTAGSLSAANSKIPVDMEIGYGVRPVATTRNYGQGNMTPTENPLDLCIEGNGFLRILMPDGTYAYTRDGALKLSDDGRVVTSDGYVLDPEITIPAEADAISVSIDGTVSASVPGEIEPLEIGQIELTRFINPQGLNAVGHNLYTQSPASGSPVSGNPTEGGLGRIVQGYLELSNVDIVTEMVNMIVAQRAYEINSKAIQTSEDMAGIVNSLRR
ncbi:MAG: flagellar basal-body rod protein FlgG [candidate division Zixibacteria bacterium CG_4_9_14_3_um_filter_46_8]|nr:MAG: flagellar basal-body rod protein FlgG [candidate division Zixibacteria bacterium CG_4_9_14_3_um_filter_46_8]